MLDAVDLWNTQIAARHAQPRLAWHECAGEIRHTVKPLAWVVTNT
jgi:hypothetical protein